MRTYLSILLSIFAITSTQAKEKVVAKTEVKELTKEQVYSTLKAAHDWYTMENYVMSAKYFDDAAKYIKDEPGELYDATCSYALAGQKKKAIETLKSVIGTGWDNYDHINKDTDLNSLREEPEFKALMDTLLNKIKASEKKRAFWRNPGEKTKIGGKEFEVVGVPGDTVPMTAARVLNLQVFNDEIYLGYGDGVNNMGPVAIMSFQPDKGKWNYHFMAQEHAIVNFRQIGDELYIMGGKPWEGFTSRNFNRNFEFGSIFRLFKNGSFVKYHSIPRTLNVQDVAKLNDKFFCTAGTANEDWSQNLGCIYESKDNCASWKPVYNLEPLKDKTVRANSMKEFNGKVYAFGFSFFVPKFGEQVFVPDAFGEKEAMVYDGKNWSKENIIAEPGVIMVTGAEVFNNQLIMNVGFYDIPPQRISKLYAYTGKGKAVKVFDGEELMIDDMFIADGTLYLLLNKEENRAIVSTKDLKDFKTILEFPKEVGVSCLAVHKGYVYLGTPRGSVLRAKM
ncbi:MAG: hypothetical protein PHX21_05665 [bacterium]|nr:hypothetical protein [bacterium]